METKHSEKNKYGYLISAEGVTYKSKEKVLVTGPNSSGTSFVTLLLANMGLDSGFDSEYVKERMENGIGKGMEFLTYRPTLRDHRRRWNNKRIDVSPELIKKPLNPNWGDDGKTPQVSSVINFVDRFNWDVKHIIMTIRDPKAWIAATQRHDMKLRGELRYKFKDEQKPEQWMGYAWALTYQTILDREYPHSVLLFPKCVDDAEYCYRELRSVVGDRKEEFMRAHKDLANPDMVHVR
jgi:hypothetical protein